MQCDWLQLCTTVAMGMRINNCWELFHYGVNRDHYDKFIGIREFLERFDMECFSNSFTTYTGTPEKNIHYLGEIDNRVTLSTCHRLDYSSSSPRNSEIIKISEITIAIATHNAIGHTASKEV